MRRGPLSLSSTFALLSLVVIGIVTALQMSVQWGLLREDLLEWERTVSADAIRAEAYAVLDRDDLARWQEPSRQARLEQVFRRALGRYEVVRVKLYDAEMRVIWSDEPRLLGQRFPDNTHLAEALSGQTVASLERALKPENLYERGLGETVELYVPLTFPGGVPGTAQVAGVVEVYKNPSRVLQGLSRDRWIIVAASLAGAIFLYGTLFGIVHRASRTLERQRADLERQAASLALANTELRATQDALRASERLAAIGEVSAAVAHGIRNPLANIRAAAQVARETGADADTVKRYLGAIGDEVDRLGRWLRDLLDFVRPFELRPARVDLVALLDDLLRLLAGRVAEGQVRVVRELPASLPLTADEVQLQQALLGVLENALDVIPAGGTLAIRAEPGERGPAAGVRVSIRDSGPGIAPERLARLFEPFYTTKTRGTGLGLAITRRVVEAHAGSVQVESVPGAGTTFVIWLPLGADVREAA